VPFGGLDLVPSEGFEAEMDTRRARILMLVTGATVLVASTAVVLSFPRRCDRRRVAGADARRSTHRPRGEYRLAGVAQGGSR
jgi:hypothetical protein